MGLGREWAAGIIHTSWILKQSHGGNVKNHADTAQVIDFNGFFSAQNWSELIKRPFHAGLLRGGCSLSTKLSTKDVGTSHDR
jgi:hypothetical protein